MNWPIHRAIRRASLGRHNPLGTGFSHNSLAALLGPEPGTILDIVEIRRFAAPGHQSGMLDRLAAAVYGDAQTVRLQPSPEAAVRLDWQNECQKQV